MQTSSRSIAPTACSGGDPATPPADVLMRGRRSIGVDLKSPAGVELVLQLVEQADALFEPFRPGVAERLGIGPDECLARNPKLVYGRMTGWGQDGPYAHTAGHDINYIALAGALEPIGRRGEGPMPPLNLVGDFGGGGMLLAYGMVCALLEAQRSGKGQVVDAAMVDGAACLMMMFHAFRAMGIWEDQRGSNLLDTGAYFYDVYETTDGKYVSIGSLEPQFYAELLRLTGLEGDPDVPWQHDKNEWPRMKERMRESSRRRPATSGARSWKAPTCASRRCCHSPRRRSIRTTCTARRSSSSRASCSRRPRLGSAARRARCSVRPPTPASTPTRS